jgi:hypothetical protein
MGSSQSDIYSDAASFGQTYSTIVLVIAFIVGLLLLGISISLLMQKNKHTDKINATIIDSSCDPMISASSTRNCNVSLQYDYNGKNYKVPNFNYNYYSSNNSSTNTNLINSQIIVYVDPSNPIDVSSTSKETERNMAFVILGFGVFIVLIAGFRWWLVRKSKFFAAAEGAGAGISLFRRAF